MTLAALGRRGRAGPDKNRRALLVDREQDEAVALSRLSIELAHVLKVRPGVRAIVVSVLRSVVAGNGRTIPFSKRILGECGEGRGYLLHLLGRYEADDVVVSVVE